MGILMDWGVDDLRVMFGRWLVEPCGTECWQIRSRTKRGYGSATKFPRTLGQALELCAERDARDGVEGDYDLFAALDRYESLVERIERAANDLTESENS